MPGCQSILGSASTLPSEDISAVWWAVPSEEGTIGGLCTTPKWKCEKERSNGHHPPEQGGCRGGSCGRRCRGERRPRHTSNGMDAQSSTLLWQWNDYLLAITSPTDRWRGNCNVMPCAPLAINMGMVLRHTPHILPSRPNQHGDRTMAASR